MTETIVIAGAGQAGIAAAAKLRAMGHSGAIKMIGQEPEPPYQRPPLSKKYLMGEMERERLYLRPAAFFAEQDIDLTVGQSVDSIDRQNRLLHAGADAISYDHLILTTGATPRKLPAAIGGTLGNVHVMRSLADADALSPIFTAGKRLLVVGGGYIGLEAAAVAVAAGLEVTLIEMADRILQRVAARETSDYFRDLHTRRGVRILEQCGLERLTGDTDVTGAVLSDGTTLGVDLVIVGIGVTPNTGIAEKAGLRIDNGIAVNEFGQTSDPNIWSAGDCASFPIGDGRIRLESVPNAIDQAENLAANILRARERYVPKVWFWSDQYDVKLQIAGYNAGYDDVVSRAGSKPGSASFWYYRRDALIAVDAMNDPRAYMIGKRMIESGKTPSRAAVGDASTDLKSL